ncbi:tetratricopeptide repeat protein [Agarivorans sp. TSD2052]|uniref:tetratricopeptide repeat protein n=1 Tax=Agarivorans sp. TSD2052 TaxID=2937286 RepID=UPI00200D3A1E|nr:tetratricopeptide repeat protein [Agarivorans sp. TSD2052]UPW19496.1 tetratricopeptide repeat protein [Agarivorans sp. TSD2052]
MSIFTRLLRSALLLVLFTASSAALAVDYVGTETCIRCHQDAYEAWQGSHHQLAMQHASEDAILGDFNNAQFTFNDKINRFYTKGEQFWVNIEGPDGQFHDYQIKYTFGVTPLQQYMVEFDDGRVQLIPFTWDARPKQEGGQRWYHLYPEMAKTDEFYWTNTGQNWNFMCADCHSTDLKKNYNAETNQYNTTWAEISVGCEACHGPASEHLALANLKQDGGEWNNKHFGFDRDLSKAVKEWVYQQDNSTLQPKAIEHTQQVPVCAQCHSRRIQLSEKNDHVNGAFQDRYLLSMITPQLYHHDGQIYDEDYVYGSYLQTKMAEKGVSCTNCHDPHSAQLKVPEQAVCAQCHVAAEYLPDNHTFHQADSEASKCTTCHMPETTYMQVDPRRDHSWQIPRPDLSKHINTPNVCTRCHTDQSNQWAEDALIKWFPDSRYRNPQHFSIAFYASSVNHPSAGQMLSYIAQDQAQSNIIRASAIQRLANHPNKDAINVLASAVKDNNDMIRLGAVKGSSAYPLADRWKLISPLLNDPVYAVRTEAAGALVAYWKALSAQQRSALASALAEYIEIQTFSSDRGASRTNLGNIHRAQGHYQLAIEAYQQAIKVEPNFANSYINLADLYRAQKNEPLAFNTLMQGIKAQPKAAILSYSAGLSLLRQNQPKQALDLFKKASTVEPNNPQYWLVYGLSLEKFDLLKADEALQQAFDISGNPDHLYARCEILVKYKSAGAPACIEALKPYAPDTLIQQLNSRLK